jgi:hypothetical protein
MSEGTKRYRRRASYAALLVAVAALGVWASYAIAGTGGEVTVDIEYHNDDCGDSQGKRVIGAAQLRRSGDMLKVIHKVHGADPGTNYYLYLYDGGLPGCPEIAYLGKFKVDSSGDGSKSNTANVAGTSGKFVVCDYNGATGLYDCSLLGQLGKNQATTITTVITV